MQKILALELILKLSAGLLLLLVPRATSKIFGLPREQSALWPRLLGGVLVGLAGGVYLEIAKIGGISIPACIMLNFVGAGTLITLLILNGAAPTWRGRTLLGLTALLLFGLGLVEVAYI